MSDEGWWGWVPNLSGEVCKTVNVENQITVEGDSRRKYSYRSDDPRNIKASSKDDGIVVMIKIHDDKGICSLKIEKNVHKLNERILITSVWKDFRSLLDSCSNDVCDCSAMDKPVRSSEKDVKKAIAGAFITTMELLTDSPVYTETKRKKWKRVKEGIWRKEWEKRLVSAMRLCNVSKTNHVYFKGFLEIYSGCLEDSGRLEKIMDARYEKAKIVYEDTMRRSELGFKKLSSNYTLMAISVAVATLAVRLIMEFL